MKIVGLNEILFMSAYFLATLDVFDMHKLVVELVPSYVDDMINWILAIASWL